MKHKGLTQIQREHELLMTEIMLLKDEVKSLRRKLAEKQPQTTQVIKVNVDHGDGGWGAFPY